LVSTSGRVSLTFNNEQALQDFVMEIRKGGITYGIELAQLKEEMATDDFDSKRPDHPDFMTALELKETGVLWSRTNSTFRGC
jgi:hypothetical protein